MEWPGRTGVSILVLLLVSATLSSCSGGGSAPEKPEIEEEVGVTPEAEASAVFVYDEAKSSSACDPEIFLTFYGDPVNIPGKGFVKLKGVVTAGGVLALLEVGGVGECVRTGGRVGRYVLSFADSEVVRLMEDGTDEARY